MISPIAFSFAGINVHWYGIIIATAILIGVWLAMRETKRRGMDPDMIIDLCLLAVPLAVICARIYYVIFFVPGPGQINPFAADPLSVLYIWDGGLAIYGAVIGGMLAVLIFCKWRKLKLSSFVDFLDILAPSLILGQAMGRWGNFFNQEAYGYIVTDPAMQWFPFAVFIQRENAWHLATFFYESLWCFLVFGFLLWYQRRQKTRGNVILWYFFLYGIERAFVEGLRTDSLWLIPDAVRVSQALSLVLALAAGALLLYNNHRKKRLEEAPPE